MELVGWNDWNNMMNLGNSIHGMMNDRFFASDKGYVKDMGNAWNPAVDVFETDDAYVVNAELPGVNKDDITIDVKDRILTVKGERTRDNEVKDKRCYRRERIFGKFERSFTLPQGVDSHAITAAFNNGVLKISIPRPEIEKPRQITVH